jgi:ATPase subunit of ABC transporter with duplicated ATPase domains
MEPDILLLDEPTNHLDAESVAWLERHLQEYKGTVIAVTHDRYFLDNVAGWILELDRGQGIPWKGNYSSWLEQKSARLAVEEKTESRRQRTLARELEWIRMSPKARQAKGKARVNAYEDLLGRDFERFRDEQEIPIPPGPRLGVQGLRRPVADRRSDRTIPARRDRRHHRAQRGGQDDTAPDDRRPGNLRPRDDPHRRNGQDGLCRPIA